MDTRVNKISSFRYNTGTLPSSTAKEKKLGSTTKVTLSSFTE